MPPYPAIENTLQLNFYIAEKVEIFWLLVKINMVFWVFLPGRHSDADADWGSDYQREPTTT